ncbi:MAG: putative toxin-antitoxin system toxin component, PIN family [Burkholderiaceae bacterium]
MNEHPVAVELDGTHSFKTLVLDTNAWLDWLVFADPQTALLGQQFDEGRLTLPASPSGRAEFVDVISRDKFRLDHGQQSDCIDRYDHCCQMLPNGREAGRHTKLRCSDPDDQQFLELAVGAKAGWLLTRDRALLKLARRAWRDHQFRILSLAEWSAQGANASNQFGSDKSSNHLNHSASPRA